MRRDNRHILEVLECARRLLRLADAGEADACDDSCSVLYGTVRDCAYKLRCRAERERCQHAEQGRWKGDAHDGGSLAGSPPDIEAR